MTCASNRFAASAAPPPAVRVLPGLTAAVAFVLMAAPAAAAGTSAPAQAGSGAERTAEPSAKAAAEPSAKAAAEPAAKAAAEPAAKAAAEPAAKAAGTSAPAPAGSGAERTDEPAAKAAAEPAAKAADEPAQDGFEAWLAGLRAEAAAAGISEQTLQAALGGVRPIQRVIELDRRQPHSSMSFARYLRNVIPKSRVEYGRRMMAKHRDVLEEIRRRYGVQPRFVVALWAIETDFGRNTGGFPVVDALATLAHEGRRAEFFRKELLLALRILDEGHITPARMKGSWAGAMGQCQFMPSSFVARAVDHDGDGRRDIWTTLPDVFGSAANYLRDVGWKGDQTWGRRVRLPKGFDDALVGLDVKKPLAEWQALGVRRPNGRDLPRADMEGSLVRPGGTDGPVYLVYDNYRVLLDWNRSKYFATAVGLLADRIGR